MEILRQILKKLPGPQTPDSEIFRKFVIKNVIERAG